MKMSDEVLARDTASRILGPHEGLRIVYTAPDGTGSYRGVITYAPPHRFAVAWDTPGPNGFGESSFSSEAWLFTVTPE